MYNDHALKNAYIKDYWNRGTVSEFGYVLRYFANRIGEKDIDSFEFSRGGYKRIAKIADRLIVEALSAKLAAERGEEPDKEMTEAIQETYRKMMKRSSDEDTNKKVVRAVEPSRIAGSVVDDFVEILVSIKHIAQSERNFDEMDEEIIKEKEQEEEEYENSNDQRNKVCFHVPQVIYKLFFGN